MSFLAKLGSFLAKGIALLSGLGPLITPWLGSQKSQETATKIVNDLTQIGQVVLGAEAFIQTSGSGTQKLVASTPLVMQILKTSELVANHQIGNESLFEQGATKITSGMADVLNSLKADNVKAQGQPVVISPVSISVATSIESAIPSEAPAPNTTAAPIPVENAQTKHPLALT